MKKHNKNLLELHACCLCGRVPSRMDSYLADFAASEDLVAQSDISITISDTDDGMTTTSYVLCPDCFNNRLVRWIKEEGGHALDDEKVDAINRAQN